MVNYVSFPAVSNANEDGLLAMGGELTLDTLVSAYAQGVFPWFNHDQPILWWSPDPRMVLYPEQVKVSRSLAKVIRKQTFQLTCNQAFEQVMQGCALRGLDPTIGAEPTEDTWITDSMHTAYNMLFKNGYAHSIEVWLDGGLVGGLYGVALGDVFFGESMFSQKSNASKVALIGLCQWLQRKNFKLIDCQVASEHLFSLGAVEVARSTFIKSLTEIDIHAAKPDFATDFEFSGLELAANNVIKKP